MQNPMVTELFPYSTLFRSDAQRALGPHQQIAQIIAGIVFFQRAQALIELTVRHHRLDAHGQLARIDRKSTRLNSSHVKISYAVFCLKKKNSRSAVQTSQLQ